MAEFEQPLIPKRILKTLLSSLSAGVVPRSGAPYVAIGRAEEVKLMLSDLESISEGGAALRFLIGRYGSGKSFLIQLVRGYALERNYLCADADLSPERRLSSSSGGGIATYRELLRNLASRACPDGGALKTVLSRYFAQLSNELAEAGIFPESNSYRPEMKKRLYAAFSELEGGVGGFDFASVLGAYFQAELDGNDERKSTCLRWLRGEFSTKTEAKGALGFPISSIIGDENWYDFIKLFAALSLRLGYRGLVVFLDECVNLYKIPNRLSREANYEKLLAIFNDTLQGRATGLAVFFGGTVQFLEDTRRGLFSYEALKSRLADSRFVEGGYTTTSSPVIRLRRLSENELLALLHRLCRLFGQLYPEAPLPAEGECEAFLAHSLKRAGAAELLTPREMIRDFLSMLEIVREHEAVTFSSLLSEGNAGTPDKKDEGEDGEGEGDFDTLFDFKF